MNIFIWPLPPVEELRFDLFLFFSFFTTGEDAKEQLIYEGQINKDKSLVMIVTERPEK